MHPASPAAAVLLASNSLWQVVRKVDASGIITTVAGNGDPGFSGDGGAATDASLDQPTGLAFDRQGNLLIADSSNHAVRLVNLADGSISTVAGNGTEGYSGDGQAATAALLSFPSALAVDGSGNILSSMQGTAS